MSKYKNVKRLEKFKTYALGLVNAATTLLLGRKDLLEGGSECLSGLSSVDAYKCVNPFDAILATMSIAKDYYEDLQVIREASESDLSQLKIKNGLKQNIDLILLVLETSLEQMQELTDEEVFRKYLFRHNQNPSKAAAGDDDDENLKSALKCYTALLGFEVGRNEKFFDEFSDGLELISRIMTGDNDDDQTDSQRAKLDKIVEGLPARELIPIPSRSMNDLKNALADME